MLCIIPAGSLGANPTVDIKYAGEKIKTVYYLLVEVYIYNTHQHSLRALTLFLFSKEFWGRQSVMHLFYFWHVESAFGPATVAMQ